MLLQVSLAFLVFTLATTDVIALPSPATEPATPTSCNCQTTVCPALPEVCPRGSYRDKCGCCPLCFKDIGEKCGGPDSMYGECGAMLFCKTDSQDLQTAENLKITAAGELPVGTCWDPRTPSNLYVVQNGLRRFFHNLTRNAAENVRDVWSALLGSSNH